MFITLPSAVLEKVRTDSAIHANTILYNVIVVIYITEFVVTAGTSCSIVLC